MKTTGLSLAEAHASGRRYKRAPYYKGFERLEDGLGDTIWVKDALAMDYELEPEAKLLTREEVRQAVLAQKGQVNIFHDAAKICDALFGPEDKG